MYFKMGEEDETYFEIHSYMARGQGRQGRRLSSTTPGIPPPPARDNPVNHVIRESFDWDGQHPNQQLRSATSERVITDNCVL